MTDQIVVSGKGTVATTRPVGLWLLLCCAFVFALIVLGGVTRLTQSGLSIVEWQPVTGALPPLSERAWRDEFTKYRATPEYRLVNEGMALGEYKTIYWVEYAHRLLARFAGVVFLIPFLYFLLAGRLSRPLAQKLGAVLALGVLQAVLGWYLVLSGLADGPEVSQYRLTAHLGLAVVIYGAMFWLALGLLRRTTDRLGVGGSAARRIAAGFVGVVFFVILSGGLVAGLDAGFGYNTFPLMEGQLIPAALFPAAPWWVNLFEDPLTVQFDHRALALLALLGGIALWLRLRSASVSHATRLWSHAVLAALVLQVLLGISTLLYVVPIPLAAAHQGGALLLFTASLGLAHAARVP
ncbi:MAG: COX15/CtaA family protein [Rhodospirillaceae bacterium]|nr:COX15/CtaA family protein [Rhodospirillaceae bacterium]